MSETSDTGSANKNILKPERLSAWVDGIFAFAMTLLVITIDVPKVPIDQLAHAVYSNWQNFTAFVTSFLLLAVFWIQHQRIFNNVARINETFIWLNIFNMMFVVFIPFTTNLVEDYSHSVFATVMFNSNLLIVGYVNCMLYKCVYRYKLVEVESLDIKPELHRFYVIPITSILAIFVSFIFPSHGGLVYLLIPIYYRFKNILKT